MSLVLPGKTALGRQIKWVLRLFVKIGSVVYGL